MYRIKIEIPADADDAVVKALRDLARSLADAVPDETTTAPENSYSLTIHAFPDKEKE
jgi:hypothetical protein